VRIVICDDHRLLLEALTRALTLRGFTVEASVSTPEEAVAAVDRLRPELLLLDLGFPHGNGAAAAREVLMRFPKTRVVIITGSTEAAAVQEAARLGVAGFVRKDERLDGIVSALHRAAAGDGRLDRSVQRTLETTPPAPGDRRSDVDRLTAQERVVLRCLADGLSTAEIVDQLGISPTTVRSHIQSILSKLGVHSRIQAVALLRDPGPRAVGQ
jgi:DNA-binding NarL/FixJ family response regulator